MLSISISNVESGTLEIRGKRFSIQLNNCKLDTILFENCTIFAYKSMKLGKLITDNTSLLWQECDNEIAGIFASNSYVSINRPNPSEISAVNSTVLLNHGQFKTSEYATPVYIMNSYLLANRLTEHPDSVNTYYAYRLWYNSTLAFEFSNDSVFGSGVKEAHPSSAVS